MSKTPVGVRVVGPLAVHADGFGSWLSGHWYAPLTATEQLRLMAHVSRWLASQGLDCSALTDEVAWDFLRARRTAGYRNLLSPRALVHLLDYLRLIGVVAEPVDPIAATPTAVLLQDYRRYLLGERRLMEGTVAGYEDLARRFLAYCGRQGALDLAAVTASGINGFVLDECHRRPSGSAKHVVTPLRSLLRFGQLRGLSLNTVQLR